MLGPLPTGSRFIHVGASKCYGAPTAYAQQVPVGAKGFAQNWRLSSTNYKRPDYLGAALPLSSTANVLRTSVGPFYSPAINYTLKSTVSLFDTTDMLGELSGVHDVQALIVTVDNLLLSINGESTATIFPFLNGYVGGLFNESFAEGLMGAALNMQGDASISGFADD